MTRLKAAGSLRTISLQLERIIQLIEGVKDEPEEVAVKSHEEFLDDAKEILGERFSAKPEPPKEEKPPMVSVSSQPPRPDPPKPKPAPKRSRVQYSPGFQSFWKNWPRTERRIGKKSCYDIWRRKGLEDKADQMIQHVSALKKTKKWQDGFEPAPRTYLSQEQYRDSVVVG